LRVKAGEKAAARRAAVADEGGDGKNGDCHQFESFWLRVKAVGVKRPPPAGRRLRMKAETAKMVTVTQKW
jgi:hypothetical protein